MRSKLFMVLMASAVALVPSAAPADEYDFVGYQFARDAKRDYDRGFFIGAEAWYANPKNLHFEPVISSAGGGTIGGTMLDTDFNNELSPRGFLGYKANRRIGTFTLSYWDFNEDASRFESGGIYSATASHPGRGDVTRDTFHALADVDVEYAQFDWSHDMGWGRKFAGFWGVGLQAWEIEYETQALHFDAAVPDDGIFINQFSSTKGYGGIGFVGGRYHFNKYVSAAGQLSIGFSATEQDYLYTDQNTFTGAYFAAIERQDTELTTVQYGGEASIRVRVAAGFEVDLGYRYLLFDDAIAEDQFVDDNAKFITIEQTHELGFEGPYLNMRYITGVQKVDGDGDGVLDVYDDCDDTPSGAWVNEKGCPRDLDEDGVYDGIDRCPGTAFGTRVDEFGCGVDTDGDTVPDGLDMCPNTPTCARVDGKGCPLDADGDGVSDGCDACPGTAAGRDVDSRGCENKPTDGDSDGDTVPDSRDKCPNTERGAQVDSSGCAMVVSMMVHFDTDSAEINASDMPLLDRIAAAIEADGGSFEIAGHADHRASEEYNQGLSERRAESVRQYLIDRGCSADKLVAVGYSENRPIASNDTESGMAMNRRVEIIRR
jgi:outer membrane protein OmpA-like peptidoglycan-associated protein